MGGGRKEERGRERWTDRQEMGGKTDRRKGDRPTDRQTNTT